ncbi:MAG: hypothetical protein Q9205_004478 [Flavoplaca limonia]
MSFDVCHCALESLCEQKWLWLILLLLVAQFDKVLKSYIIRRPANILIVGSPTVLGHWLTSLRFLLVATGTVKDGYKKAGGGLFAVPALNKYTVFATSREQVEEVSNAPINQLSFNAAIDEQFMPHLIFNGFRFDPKDPRFSIPLHAMKVQLRNNLQALIPLLRSYTAHAFSDEFPEHAAGKANDWTTFHPHLISSKMVQKLNNVIMVGQELTDDPAYLAASLQYTRDVVITAELLRFTPSSLQNAIGWLSMNRTGAKNIVDRKVTAMMWDRVNNSHCPGRVQYPEYLEPLRREIEQMANNEVDESNYDNMPLMDSFLKETARVYPTVIRKHSLYHLGDEG